MKNLEISTMENLEGGLCALNVHTGECRPSVCTGLGIAYDMTGSNPNLPLIACIA